MNTLPDPRPRGAGVHPWHALADGALAASVAAACARNDAAPLAAALADASSAAAYRRIWGIAASVAEQVEASADSAVVTRYFAMPLVLVAGSRGPASLDGVLQEVAAVQVLLEAKGAVGPTRNFGLSNALVAPEALAAVSPLAVYRAIRGAAPLPEFAPAPIVLAPRGEVAYLRFLVGAGIAPAHAPSFVETAANIGAWGMPLAQLLGKQLAQPGVELLVLPRPPVPLLAAVHAGQAVQLEAAFNLFVSNELRRFRLAVGDPAVIVSAHQVGTGGAELRITLSTPFDESLTAGFRWPLDPRDDLPGIVAAIESLFAQCRIDGIEAVPQVLPDLTAQGVPWFPRGRD
ncbi:MAG: hypothetical protein ACREUW_06590 [Burkholderiales bacterium]